MSALRIFKYERKEENPALVFVPEKTSQDSQIFYIQDQSGTNLAIHFHRKTGSRLKMLCHKMHFQNLF